ncbi:helix-turn-helix domain-containing protein [Paenibacillus sp. 1P07SE]|uniref:helix-turn-helix domain-containing protein n=1 Tax=Paenibacillus sp. 1P07SE TaxID=3132209 RepID=UPI0039A60039
MDLGKYAEVDAAIAYIHQHLYEPIELSQLADHVSYSKYHFARIFKERTGLSPLYYISALRLQKAKDLLLTTNLTIRDIGLEIGQQSVGTFSTRFIERVGMSPARFRQSRESAGTTLGSLQALEDWQERLVSVDPAARLTGTIRTEAPFEGVILIGLFPRPIPEGVPLYGTLVNTSSFCFTGVKPGTYYLMATTISWGTGALDLLMPRSTLRTRSRTPIVVRPGVPSPPLEITLHPPRLDDPPILISLPLLMERFMSRMHGASQLSGRQP